MKINGITIPRNMTVAVPVYALHHDPEHWPEPEEIKPGSYSVCTERKVNISYLKKVVFAQCLKSCIIKQISKQNKGKINPYTYLTQLSGDASDSGDPWWRLSRNTVS